MTSLLTLDAEARRTLRRLPARRGQALQASLIALCEAHWPEMRGPEPASRVEKALWVTPPHLADLFVHLHAVADPRLEEILDHLAPPQALALLVLAEIERGDAEGARFAYAAMRVFESPAAVTGHVHASLTVSGKHEAWLIHAHRPALWRAVVGLAMQTRRRDTKAVLEVVRQLAQIQANPVDLNDDPGTRLALGMLREVGVTFLGVEGDSLRYALRGEEQEPVRTRKLAEMLAEGAQPI